MTMKTIQKMASLLVMLCAMAIGAQAQQRFELPLWEGSEVTDDAAEARLYVHLAAEPSGQAIVICPGGGYVGLAIGYEGHDFAPWLNHNGISVIVLKYRMPRQRHHIPLADAEQAMRVVRAHAAEWGIDPNNIGIMGSSAGGHLAATLATHYGSKETRPDFQVLLYPVITMDKSYTHMGSHDQLVGQDASPELEQKYSNEKQVTAETPRAFIVTPAADNIVPVKNTLNYAQALIDHKVPCSVHIYPGGFHGFGSQMSFKDAEIWHQELLRWLQRDGQ